MKKTWLAILTAGLVGVPGAVMLPSPADASSNIVNGRDRNGRDRNGRDRNGRDRNGRDRNGRDRNGRDRNGRSTDSWSTSLIFGNPNWMEYVFSIPWTQASFDQALNDEASGSLLRYVVCNYSDNENLRYLWSLGMGPDDVIDGVGPDGVTMVGLATGCGTGDNTLDYLSLRGNLGLARGSLSTGTFMSDETGKVLLTNALMAVTNGAPAADSFGDSSKIVHNLLRLSGSFDPSSSDIVEPFPIYRHHTSYVGSVLNSCQDKLNVLDMANSDPDCGYQVAGGRVFRTYRDNQIVYLRVVNQPANTRLRLRVSRGLEAADRYARANAPLAELADALPAGYPYTRPAFGIAGTSNPNGPIIRAVNSYLNTASYDGLATKGVIRVTLPTKGLYNVTWSTTNPKVDLAPGKLTDGLRVNVSTSATMGTNNGALVSVNDFDIFYLREATYYSTDGGVFNYARQDGTAQGCYTQAEVLVNDDSTYFWNIFGLRVEDSVTPCQHSAPQPGPAAMHGFVSPLFSNVFMATDKYWSAGTPAVDLRQFRSCSNGYVYDIGTNTTRPVNKCDAVSAGFANATASWRYTDNTGFDRNMSQNELRDARGRVVGEFGKGIFVNVNATTTQRDAAYNSGLYDDSNLGITVFLSSPTDWLGTNTNTNGVTAQISDGLQGPFLVP